MTTRNDLPTPADLAPPPTPLAELNSDAPSDARVEGDANAHVQTLEGGGLDPAITDVIDSTDRATLGVLEVPTFDDSVPHSYTGPTPSGSTGSAQMAA